jgi:hypothetical protein
MSGAVIVPIGAYSAGPKQFTITNLLLFLLVFKLWYWFMIFLGDFTP